MFRTAATKIAHNSTLPALAGNKDLKPLQELITSEKSVLTSLQRLSADLTKSNECLRHWGAGEGDDLQDILTVSTTLLGHLSSALLHLANHEVSIREHMKSVRTREENLDELRRRRKAVISKADTAEKRLTKMNPEHKNLQQQTELLNNLREQIRSLDWEILSEEARLGDFKRTTTKNWMMLKFGGLLECAEKATIAAEMGKLVIEEIPLDTTQPGSARTFYTGHEKTEKLVTEAQRCISEVVFDPQLVGSSIERKTSSSQDKGNSIDGLPNTANSDSSAFLQDTRMTGSSGFGQSPPADEFGGLGDRRASRGYGTMPISMPSGPITIRDDGSRLSSTVGDGHASNFSSAMPPPPSHPSSRFGSAGGSQFSTFPARKASLPTPLVASPSSPPQPNQGLSLQPLDDGQGMSSSFAAEVADALAYAEHDGQSNVTQGKLSLDGPAPSYQTHEWNASGGLPRGAAPPVMEPNPWEGGAPGAAGTLPLGPPSHHIRESAVTEDGESQLPYASPPPAERQLPHLTGDQPSPHVHFGGAQSIPEGNDNGQVTGSMHTTEQGPSPPSLSEVEANKAAAAREVAREMDMLSFNPPPGPPPGHNDNRAPSPLLPPAPPFANQQHMGPAPEYGATLSPRSDGYFSSSKTDLRSPPLTNIEAPSPQMSNSASSSPSMTHQTRPSMSITTHSPSPTYSYNSTAASAYDTPLETPAIQPLRTGSPASPSMLTPGARTISAAAFKRTGVRSPSGGPPPDTRLLPEVNPLSLRKKSGNGASLPPSPYAGSREALSSPPAYGGQSAQQEPRSRPSNESLRSPAPDYESSYDVITPYGDQPGNAPHEGRPNDGTASPGYGRGQFATNLEGEGLR